MLVAVCVVVWGATPAQNQTGTAQEPQEPVIANPASDPVRLELAGLVAQAIEERDNASRALARRKETALELDELSLRADCLHEEAPILDVDQRFGDLQQLKNELQELDTAAVASVIDAEARLLGAQATHGRQLARVGPWRALPDFEATIATLEGALAERVTVAAESVALARENREIVLELLKRVSRRLRALDLSLSAELHYWYTLFKADLWKEAKRVGPNLAALWSERRAAISEFRQQLGFDTVLTLLLGSFWLIILAVLWWWARRRVPLVVDLVLRRRDDRAHRLGLLDLDKMRQPAVQTLRALVDLLLGWAILAGPLRLEYLEIGLALLFYLQVAGYRLVMGATKLALARHPEVRPALVTLSPPSHRLALRTVRSLVLWFIGFQLSVHICEDLLGAFDWAEALSLIFRGVLVLLLVGYCFAWQPLLAERLRQMRPHNQLVGFVTRKRLFLFRPLQGFLSAIAVLTIRVWDTIRSRFFTDKDDELSQVPDDHTELPDDLVESLLSRNCPDEGYVSREEIGAQLDAKLARWMTHQRRGMTALVGDHGLGKRIFLDHWVAHARDEGHTVLRHRLDVRMRTSAQAASWIGSMFAIDSPPTDTARLAEAVEAALSSQIVVLEDLHLAFLRSVGGFGALESLLYVINATGSKCMWIVSMQLSSWRFLQSLDGLVNTEVFDRVLELEPLSENELERLVLARVTSLGYSVSFHTLLKRADLLGNRAAAIERAKAAYFRMLHRASDGNPAVALRLWAESLHPIRASRERLVVRICSGLTESVLSNVRDQDLFVLAALYTHRTLNEGELVAVTNMRPAVVRVIIKNLEMYGILAERARRVAIQPRYLAVVSRTLRRRHFIHWSQ